MHEDKNNSYMSDAAILDFIKGYINQSIYNYAVLIDGHWGSGKTFFVKHTLIPYLKEDFPEKKIVYVSLYGCTTKDDITRQILIESLPLNSLMKSKAFNSASSIGKVVLGGALSLKGISFPDLAIDISNFLSLDNCILIFDDLERCNLSANVVLGYINNFVEHDGLKVVIVANEAEITTTQLDLNRELKFLAASNRNIKFNVKEDETKGNNVISQDGSIEKIDVKELYKRVNCLFGEDKLYKQIKEKLIGTTIYYRPDFSRIIDTIAENSISSQEIRKIILENKHFIVEKLNYYNHPNIRTILFAIDKFNTVAKSLLEAINLEELKDILNEIFKYTFIISILDKTGQCLPAWQDDEEIAVVSVDQDLFSWGNYVKGFKFINNFILGSSYDSCKTAEIILEYIESQKMQIKDPNDPLYRITNGWWLMEDQEAADLMGLINRALQNEPKKYHLSSYSRILYFNITLNTIGIQAVSIADIVELMKNNIKCYVDIDMDHSFNIFGYANSFEDKDNQKLYGEHIKELYDYINDYNEVNKQDKIAAMFSDPNTWDITFNRYVMENEGKIYGERAFLSKLDLEVLLELIKGSNIEQIQNFRTIILHIYRVSNISDFFSTDAENIASLIVELNNYFDEIIDKQKIRATNIKFLIQNLTIVLEKLSK